MSLGTFTPATAYDHSYLYEPAAQAATLRVRDADGTTVATYARHIVREDIGSRDWQFHAEAMGLPENATVFLDWPDIGAAQGTPQVDDSYDVGGVFWIITHVSQRHFGAGWVAGVVRASE